MSRRSLSFVVLPAILASLAACASPAVAVEVAGDGADQSKPTAIFSSCDKPVWPVAAHDSKLAGTVDLSFLIDTNGSVLESNVRNSSGHGELDEAARVGIAKCKFNPAVQNGTATREWAHVRYVWTHSNSPGGKQ